MEKLKNGLKTFLIIFIFLLFNILIDGLTGAFIPILISGMKTGKFIFIVEYAIYGLLGGQILKLLLLSIYIKNRNETYKINLNRNFIQKEKINQPLKLVGISLGTIGFGLLLTNIIVKVFEGTALLDAALKLLDNAFSGQGTIDSVIIILVVAIGAPLVEELLFRGVLLEEISNFSSRKTSYFLTALIFGLYHFNIIQSPNTFFMGLVLAYTYDKSKSIKASIFVHAINNIIALLPIADLGLGPIGLLVYGSFIIIGIYSLKTLEHKA